MLTALACCAFALSGIIVCARWARLTGESVGVQGSIGWTWYTSTFTLIEVGVSRTWLTLLHVGVIHEPIGTPFALISLRIVELANRCVAYPAYFIHLVVLVAGWAWYTLAACNIEMVANRTWLTSLRGSVEELIIWAVLALLDGRVVELLHGACLT